MASHHHWRVWGGWVDQARWVDETQLPFAQMNDSVLEEIESREAEMGRELIGEPGRGALREGSALVVRRGEGIGVLAPTPEGSWGLDVVATSEEYEGVIDEALRLVGDDSSIRLWVKDGDGGDPRFRHERRLLIMGRSLPGRDPVVPEGFVIRSFGPATDRSPWLEVNNAAFEGHPENGGWTESDLKARMSAEWFDPDGLRMVWDRETLAGSCWIKQHPDHVGEIHIIAVSPSYQGRGLGMALMLDAMEWMTHHGDEEVILYTEADNQAVELYESLGFEVRSTLESMIHP